MLWRGGKHELDSLAEVFDRTVERVDLGEQLGDHDTVMLDLKAANKRLA